MEINWSKYKSSNPTMKPNKMLIPVNNFGFNDDDIKEFNDIYLYCLKMEKEEIFSRQFVITKSGGISIKQGNIKGCMWLLTVTKSIAEILIRNIDARYYRFIIGFKKNETNKESMWGRKAFFIYTNELKKDNFDINSLAISTEEGKAIKETIPSPKIDLLVPAERTYYNAHHIDLNSAFNAGMMKAYPQLEKTVRRMYNMRKEYTEYKNVLNMTQGVMQSSLTQYRFSHISKAGYVFTNEQIEIMSKKLQESGRRVLSYNTDGIWYQGDLYEDDTFGSDIGQWKTDYKNCKIRYKSKGAYEFIDENGVYKPVVRGELSIERTNPRENWTWEDNILMENDIVTYTFVKGKGFIRNDTI